MAVAPKKVSYVTSPCIVDNLKIRAESASAPQPLWGSMLGHCEGVWTGGYCAFDVASAKPEALWLDNDNKKVFNMCTRVLEEVRIVVLSAYTSFSHPGDCLVLLYDRIFSGRKCLEKKLVSFLEHCHWSCVTPSALTSPLKSMNYQHEWVPSSASFFKIK